MAQSFIFPDKITPSGAIACGVVTAMAKTPNAKTCVVIYNPNKEWNVTTAYSVHSVDIDEQNLSDGAYGLNFTDAMILFAQRTTQKPNILLIN